ncbi:MAG: chemotaxis-specific protein-glutamate methyltransferase CheB, partial [Thermodesulfobacteriota bacterium]
MNKIIRVLVVDDSAYVRKIIREILSKNPFIEVVGTANDGLEALEMVQALKPDIITLDLIMPRMDGISFLKEQMAKDPVPVLVVSIASESGELAFKALDEGAVDFIQKPTALATEKIFEISDLLIEKVKAVAGVPKGRVPIPEKEFSPSPLPVVAKEVKNRVDIVVLGISTGGPQALKFLIPILPKDFPVPLAMVLHMPVGYTDLYAKKLDELSLMNVVEASSGLELSPGLALLAPAGKHLSFFREPDGRVFTRLDTRPLDTPHRPSVDVLFRSAAEVFKDRVLGVVMTGMGNDGLQGAAWIKAQGGRILTEAEET